MRLGVALRERIDELRDEFGALRHRFRRSASTPPRRSRSSSTVLQDLAFTGFVIALVVLFLFLRECRAVAVVAVAVPVSLLVAGAMLYLGGYTLNLITMLGLAVGIGVLVDNSVVVYEAVQRGLERGARCGHAPRSPACNARCAPSSPAA